VDADDLVSGASQAARFFFVAERPTILAYVLMDLDRAQLRTEGRALAQTEELRMRRAEMLRRLDAREVFPAGAVLLIGPDGKPVPRPVEVVVTETELVLLSSHPEMPDDEVGRLPRREVTGIRLLDERGEPAGALTEVEELDAPTQRYVVWVERVIDGRPRGHAFVFLSYSVAAEAERDFRRQLPA
jgi:hypothetical protein